MPTSLLPEEAQRLEALHACDVLDTPPEAAFERVTAMAARLFAVPIALVALVAEERQWFKSARGIDLCETGRDVAFCAYTIQGDEILVIPDATLDPRFASNPLVTGEPHVRFYAGAPLRTSAGHRLGSLCILDTVPHPAGLDAAAKATLTELAATVVEALELRLALRRAREATAESERAARGWRTSEARYAAILETVPDCLLTIDHEGIILDHNQAAAQTFGREDGTLPGRLIHEVLLPPSLDPKALGGAAPVAGTLPAYLGAGAGGTFARHVEIPARHADGHLVLCELSVTPIPLAGLSQFTVSLRDISARRAADDRLRMLESSVDHANDAILITEAEPFKLPGPRIIYANGSLLKSTGYRLEEILGQTPRILQGPNTSEEAKDKIRRALERWQPVRQEILNYRKDGSEFWVELNIVPVANDRGWFTHWVSVQRDVTARKATEALLNQAKETAEAADRAKSEFLSGMSHELRTPLNAILGFGQLLEMGQLAQRQQKEVNHILGAGRHLLGLIDEVLDLSRIESGNLEVTPEAVDVRELLAEVAALIAPQAATRAIRVEVRAEVAGGDERPVHADRQRLRQVLLNLLSNAVKYNREGGSVELLRTALPPPADGGAARVRLTVRDSGPGITAADVARLFVPFERLDAARRRIEGTGIGLALSRRLTEAMGGQISVESAVGWGSAFSVDLPLVLGAAPVPAMAASDFAASPEADAPGPGVQTVLYIEDNPANLCFVEHLLTQRPSVRLLSAVEGGAGLELARRHCPDLILLDVHLPDVSGEVVLRELRADARTRVIPVVVLSADVTAPQVERMRAAGADNYLSKPLQVSALLRVLDDALAVHTAPAASLVGRRDHAGKL